MGSGYGQSVSVPLVEQMMPLGAYFQNVAEPVTVSTGGFEVFGDNGKLTEVYVHCIRTDDIGRCNGILDHHMILARLSNYEERIGCSGDGIAVLVPSVTYIHTAGLDTKHIVIGTDILHRIQILDKPWTKPQMQLTMK